MGHRYKFKPSKTKVREFAKKMNEIDEFCYEHGISRSRSSDSYYFVINGVSYRVSNHTVAASNAKAFNDLGQQIRDVYHKHGEEDGIVYITAGKTRIVEIYNDLANGYKLDRRGNRITEIGDLSDSM